MEYIHRRFTSRDLGGNRLRLHPISCWHIGARQCDLKFIEEAIQEIKEDPGARWIYMGDGGECVTKLSKGQIWEQTLNPQEQVDTLVELLEPIKSKGLFGIRGNHGNRIDKETGLSFDKAFLTRLSVPYLGVSALANLVVNRTSWDVFCHHGVDSGVSLQSKVKAAEKFFHILADVKITAHSHVALELNPEHYRYANNTAMQIEKRIMHQFIAGCAYDSSVEGYADEKGYPPLLPGRVIIELDGRVIRGEPAREVGHRIVRSAGDYDTEGETRKRLRKLGR